MSLTAPRDTSQRSGLVRNLPVAAATLLYAGGLAATDANGRVVPAADTANLKVAGRLEETVDNSTGAAGALNVNVQNGVFKFANSGANAITQAMVGKTAFVEDDATVASTSANKIAAGRIVALDPDGGIWVDTSRRAIAAAIAITSSQNATAAAVDLPTTEALANALKTNYNALQVDVAAIIAALNA